MTPSPNSGSGDGEDENAEQDAMMAEMGFASFGSKGKGPKAKKPKLRQDGELEMGTGGNMIPLGTGRRGGDRRGGGMDKGRGQRSEPGKTVGNVSLGTGIIGGTTGGTEVGLGMIEDKDVERNGGVHLPLAIVGNEGEDEEPYQNLHYDDEDEDMPVWSKSSSAQTSTTNVLPMKPPAVSYPAMRPPSTVGSGVQSHARSRTDGKMNDGSWDWQALRRGVRDERGDMAFYDRSFVEDPWRNLRGE